MAVPASVQAQAEEGLKAQKEYIANKKKGDTAEPAPEPGTDPAATEVPAATIVPAIAPAPDPPAKPAVDPGVSRETLPAGQPGAIDWQQKFNTLQGKYNAEVPRLVTVVNDLQARLVVEKAPASPELVVAPAVTPAAVPVPAAPAKSFITDEQKELFGEATCEFVEETSDKIAQMKIEQLLKGLNITDQVNEVKQIKADFETDRANTVKDTYYDNLIKEVPDWETLQATPDFIVWANTTDPLSGLTRGQLLGVSSNNFDHERTSTIFKTYKKDKGIVSVVQPVTVDALQNEIVPPLGAANTNTNEEKPKEFSVAEFQQTLTSLSEQRRSNKITTEEYTAKYNELITANRQGRVK